MLDGSVRWQNLAFGVSVRSHAVHSAGYVGDIRSILPPTEYSDILCGFEEQSVFTEVEVRKIFGLVTGYSDVGGA
jgi:hypothetical protein